MENEEIKITHVMADGTVRDSIEGYEVPVNEQTENAYRLLAKWAMRVEKKE